MILKRILRATTVSFLLSNVSGIAEYCYACAPAQEIAMACSQTQHGPDGEPALASPCCCGHLSCSEESAMEEGTLPEVPLGRGFYPATIHSHDLSGAPVSKAAATRTFALQSSPPPSRPLYVLKHSYLL